MSLTASEPNAPAFADTAAGRAAAQLLTFLQTPADHIRFAELDALYHPDHIARFPRRDEETRRKRWGPAPTLTNVESVSAHVAAFSIGYANGRRWKITMTVEEEPPHRIVEERWDQIFDFDVKVREATEADGPVLAELDRSTPIVQGDSLVSFDRGDDYFADTRLIEDVIVAVAEVDGVVRAVNWGAIHRPLIGGVEHCLATALHLRVHPEHQGKGLWGACNQKLWEFFNSYSVETSYAFVHRDNEAIQKDFAKNATRWSVPVLRALIPCANVAGSPAGHPATPADAPHIVEILNATHDGEEMFVPYTVDSLNARLERAPDLYTWDHVMIDGEAVLGVWPAGLGVMREEGGVRSESVRAFALDHGFLPGAEAEFESLLRSASGRLAQDGTTELALFTWEGAPSHPIVTKLGAELETFDLFIFGIPEPDGAAKRGLYVDQIYI